MVRSRSLAFGMSVALLLFLPSRSDAQDPPAPMHMDMSAAAASGWQFMQDGIVFAEFNHQGGPRGGNEFVAPNWWMGMASRNTAHGRFTVNAMFSLDPATVGETGYREVFQAGEALNGRPLVDRQHPHDLFMQLAAIWRMALNASTGFTLAGGPAGEPALGPVAFMHRASAADIPTAPLSHHTFDSTHIAYGVVTAAIDRGPWAVEASVFNGREPDQNRWDFDFGRFDSVAGRVWYRPNEQLEFQASTGHLVGPEELESGHDVQRSTFSGSWTRQNGAAFSAVTAAFGMNNTDHGVQTAAFVEGARHGSLNTLYGRFEAVQVETVLLQTGQVVESPLADIKSTVLAVTVGGVRNVLASRGWEGGFGADVSFYGVPESLTPYYSNHPVSFHLFFRLRPPAGPMGRMWNMRMSQPMAGHTIRMPMNHRME